jgi:hypothetical protein
LIILNVVVYEFKNLPEHEKYVGLYPFSSDTNLKLQLLG